MKTQIIAIKGCEIVASPAETDPSDAEQIERAENEGMTVRAESTPILERIAYQRTKSRTLELRVLAYEQILQSLISSHASVVDRVWSVPRIRETAPAQAPPSDPFQIRNRNGIWEVTENGHFCGDYLREEVAVNAVQSARKVKRLGR